MKTLASNSIWILLLAVVFALNVQAQTFENRWAVSTGGGVMQYVAPSGTQSLLNPVWSGVAQVSADRYLSGAFDFRTKIMYAPQVLFPVGESYTQSSLWDIQYQMVFKLNNGLFFKENSFFGPFVSSGLGGSYVMNRPDAYLPVSAGMRFRVNNHMAFRLETTRKFSLNQDYQPVVHALAFVYNIDTKEVSEDPRTPEPLKEQMLAQVPLPNDRDSDGILDWEDDCPQQAGYIHFRGCPSQPGSASELVADNGTPRPMQAPKMASPTAQIDSPEVDHSRAAGMDILTSAQVLPSAPGLFKRITYSQNEPFEESNLDVLKPVKVAAALQPEADSWAEAASIPAANDWGKPTTEAETKTPTRSSPTKATEQPKSAEVEDIFVAENAPVNTGFPVAMIYPESGPCGRPGQKQEAGFLLFDSGSETLPANTPQVLSELAERMKGCEDIKLVITGHTDNVGNQRDNLVLSIMRAYNVKYYLVYHHGISQSRISSTGFGDKTPTTNNASEKGRELNRRVDFELQF